jgi:hypothetical protein
LESSFYLEGGGNVRIILIQGEMVCIMTKNIKNQVAILETEKMVLYNILGDNDFQKRDLVDRTGYYVVYLNAKHILVIGG